MDDDEEEEEEEEEDDDMDVNMVERGSSVANVSRDAPINGFEKIFFFSRVVCMAHTHTAYSLIVVVRCVWVWVWV